MTEQKQSLVGTKIALIGGGGFVGHHLALALQAAGSSVTVVDSFQVNNLLSFMTDVHAENFNERMQCILERVYLLKNARIPIVLRDARDYHAVSDVFADLRPNVVVHLASVPHTNRANKDSFSTFDHSLRTLENSLDASRYYADHFIYLSSGLVYGAVEGSSASEETFCNPRGVYGALKFAGENLILSYSSDYNLPCTIIRCLSLYGERGIGDSVCSRLLEGAINRGQIPINYKETIELTHVEDVIQGILLTINNEKALNQIFNISSGSSIAVSQIAELIRDKLPGSVISEGGLRPQEQPTYSLAIDKARQVLCYNPTCSITKGLSRYVDWYLQMISRSKSLGSFPQEITRDN